MATAFLMLVDHFSKRGGATCRVCVVCSLFRFIPCNHLAENVFGNGDGRTAGFAPFVFGKNDRLIVLQHHVKVAHAFVRCFQGAQISYTLAVAGAQ